MRLHSLTFVILGLDPGIHEAEARADDLVVVDCQPWIPTFARMTIFDRHGFVDYKSSQRERPMRQAMKRNIMAIRNTAVMG